MLKIITSTSVRLCTFVSEFGNDIFSFDGTIIYYYVCEVKVALEKIHYSTTHFRYKT